MRLILDSLPLIAVALSLLAGTDASASSFRRAWNRYPSERVAPDIVERANSLQAQLPPPLADVGDRDDFEEDFKDCVEENNRRERRECFEELHSDQVDDRNDFDEDGSDCFAEDDRDDRRDCLEDLHRNRRNDRNDWNGPHRGSNPIAPSRPTSRFRWW